MAQNTKSVEDVKKAISDHFMAVNETLSNHTNRIGAVTKTIKRDQENLVKNVKKAPVRNVKEVQKTYNEKGTEMLDYLAGAKSESDNDTDYNKVLDENLKYLKEIVQQDLVKSKQENRQLVDETKTKLHNFVVNLFNERSAKGNFSSTTAVLFENFNKKLKDDLTEKNLKAGRTLSTLAPDLATMFGDPRVKSQEEIEAERLLQRYFEEEILAFSEQSKSTFHNTNEKMQKEIYDTMDKIKRTLVNIQEAADKGTKQVRSHASTTESKSIPNLPTKSDMEHNFNNLFGMAENDFKRVQGAMKEDVEAKKVKINESAKYYAEKFLGKHFGTHRDDNEEE